MLLRQVGRHLNHFEPELRGSSSTSHFPGSRSLLVPPSAFAIVSRERRDEDCAGSYADGEHRCEIAIVLVCRTSVFTYHVDGSPLTLFS